MYFREISRPTHNILDNYSSVVIDVSTISPLPSLVQIFYGHLDSKQQI